jgi:MFS family permease
MTYPPAGWNPPQAQAEQEAAHTFTPHTMIAKPQFYVLWLSFVFLALTGLMESGAFTDLAAAGAATSTAYAMAFALSNGLGKIGWGFIADRIGWRRSMMIMAVTQSFLMIAFYYMGG